MPRKFWDKWADVPELTPADLRNMSDHRRKELTVYVEILSNDGGCTTPFESFMGRMVMRYMHRGVTPEDVDKELQEFEENFKSMKSEAADFVRAYPETLNEPQPVVNAELVKLADQLIKSNNALIEANAVLVQNAKAPPVSKTVGARSKWSNRQKVPSGLYTMQSTGNHPEVHQ